jgi:hypothetical protein
MAFISLLPGEAMLNVFPDKQQLLRTTSTPRMVLIGGSSLLYGVDSACIEDTFDMPVINTGLHGGLGLRFMLSHVRPYVQPDDILVVIPEYGVLSRGYDFNSPTTAMLVFTDPRDKISHLSLTDYLEAIRGFPSVAYNKVVVRPINRLLASQKPFLYATPFYWRKSFNSNGDIIIHLNEEKTLSPEQLKGYPPLGGEIDDSLEMLNDFADYANRRGAKIFLALPPIVDTRYQKYHSFIMSTYDQLRRQLKMPIISLPSDYVYPVNYFYDTPEHLTAKGRKARTERLIADLKRIQPGITNVATITNTCVDDSKP